MANIAATTHSTPIDFGKYHVVQVDTCLNKRKPLNLRKDQEWINYFEGPISVSAPRDAMMRLAVRIDVVETIECFPLTDRISR
jgi:hypothetical protein